jgi:hypothetical protein
VCLGKRLAEDIETAITIADDGEGRATHAHRLDLAMR